jgi:TonB-dependent receptor
VNREDNEVDVGNPDLDPYEAVNYDLVFDWFFAPDSVLSLGVFYKDIDDYIVELTSNNVAEFAGFDVTRPTNGTEATVEGLEANLIYSFPEGMLSGFLLGANLTLLDTELKLLEREGESFQLPESADRIGNLYLGYERGPFSARVSVTYRDEFLSEVGDDSRYDIYVAEHTQLDVTASYQFSPAITAVMELTNLTDEPLELYQGSSAYTLQFEEYGPTFSFGLKGHF